MYQPKSHEIFREDPEVAVSWKGQSNHWHFPSRLKSFKAFPSPLEGFSVCLESIALNDSYRRAVLLKFIGFSYEDPRIILFRASTLWTSISYCDYTNTHTHRQRDHLSRYRIYLVCKQTSWQHSPHPLHLACLTIIHLLLHCILYIVHFKFNLFAILIWAVWGEFIKQFWHVYMPKPWALLIN